MTEQTGEAQQALLEEAKLQTKAMQSLVFRADLVLVLALIGALFAVIRLAG